MTAPPTTAGMDLRRAAVAALVIGVIATGLSAVGAFATPAQFFRSYLVAYIFWVGLALGCLTLVMVHHLVGGLWSVALLRVLQAGAATLSLLALLFIPLLFGLHDLYPWADASVVAADPALDHQQVYLNVPFFIVRAAVYLGVWVLLAYFLGRWSTGATTMEARTRTVRTARLRRLSAGGLVVLAFTVTFAVIDWVMSLEPTWHSSIHPALVGIGALLGAFALAAGIVAVVTARTQSASALVAQARTDIGGLFIGFAILWVYLAYSQFLLVWSGNLPEEVRWYEPRIEGGWQWLAIGVVAGQLALPLAVLMPRRLRLNARVLGIVAAGVLLAHVVDVFWLIAPAFGDETVTVRWLDVSLVAASGGWWVAMLFWRLGCLSPADLDADA